MVGSRLSSSEAARLEALRSYQILDTSAEEGFDDLTSLAAQICGTPIALITLIDDKRQWFKAKLGSDMTETSLEMGFCPFVLAKKEILIISDTLAQEQYATNPVVTSKPFIRFYAGVPLTTEQGHMLGTLCVLDCVPRQLSQKQVDGLQALSRQVMTQLKLRLAARTVSQTDAALIEVSQEVSTVTGEAFFSTLIQRLTTALDVDYAFISELVEGRQDKAKTLTVCAGDRIVNNFEYELSGTPCGSVIEQRKICCYPRNVRQRFPQAYLLEEMAIESYIAIPFFDLQSTPIGILGIMGRKPLLNIQLAESLLAIFAMRVATELERQKTEVALHQSHALLESQVQQRTVQLQQALQFESMLKRITDKVRDSLDESQILETAVQELTRVLGASCCHTALYDLEAGTATICYESAVERCQVRADVWSMTDEPEIYQQLLQGRCCHFCSIVSNTTRGARALLCCPIVDDREVLGDLWLTNQSNHAFSELEIRLVEQVATQCAIALRQARLYKAATAQVESLQKLNVLKDDFLSTVSHELRTPLSNMKMAILMLKNTTTAERQQRYLDILQAQCSREIDLVNDLLDLQRLEAGASQDLLAEAIELEVWLPDLLEPFYSRVQQHQQTLKLDLPEELPQLVTVAAHLKRILAELLNNACKYTPAGGEIVLQVDDEVTTAAIKFTLSNSVEIEAEELPHLFKKFYRVPNSDPWKQGGTGLGLALVQKLVEQMQGTISVESMSGWTTFSVEIPNQYRQGGLSQHESDWCKQAKAS